MKTFGSTEIEWRGTGDDTHVIVATRGSSWDTFCTARPDRYVDIDGTSEKPSTEPVVWKHDRSKITCQGCIAMLDGATITFEKVTT